MSYLRALKTWLAAYLIERTDQKKSNKTKEHTLTNDSIKAFQKFQAPNPQDNPTYLRLNIIIIILYYAIYGSTQAHKNKKAKIHLKYDLKYKKDMNTNIKAWSCYLQRQKSWVHYN